MPFQTRENHNNRITLIKCLIIESEYLNNSKDQIAKCASKNEVLSNIAS